MGCLKGSAVSDLGTRIRKELPDRVRTDWYQKAWALLLCIKTPNAFSQISSCLLLFFYH